MSLYIDGTMQSSSGVTYDPNNTATVSGGTQGGITVIGQDAAATVDHLTVYNTALSGTVDENQQLVSGELFFDWYGFALTGPATCEEVIFAGYQNTADLSGDCRVDLEDFAMMATSWLYCNDPIDTGCEQPWLE